jgi:hypothetical protein
MLGRIASKKDAYETARLHLVALACETVVLAALIERELAGLSGEPGAEEIRRGSWQHCGAADLLLSADASREETSLEDLCGAIDEFRTRVADMRDLRECVAEMRYAKVPRRPHFSRTSPRAAPRELRDFASRP